MTVELTPRQVATLETIAAGRIYPAAGHDTDLHRPSARILADLGLVTTGTTAAGRDWYEITDAGRRWVNTRGGKVSFRVARPGRGAQAFHGREGRS